MWSKLAPVAGLVAIGLHGCAVEQLPFPVQVALADECHKAVGKLSDEQDWKATVGEGCSDMDEETLKGFDAHDSCADALHKSTHAIVQSTCEIEVAEEVMDACNETIDAKCKTAVETKVAAWKPADEPDETESEAEEHEGAEAVVAVADHCRLGAKKFVEGEKASFQEACEKPEFADNFTELGIDTKKDCAGIVMDLVEDRHVILCALVSLTAEGAPEDPADVTHEWIDSVTEGYFKSLKPDAVGEVSDETSEEESRRIRLYQSIIKSKKWPGGKRQSFGQFALLGGSALLALVALVVVGVRRRSNPEPTLLDEEMLE